MLCVVMMMDDQKKKQNPFLLLLIVLAPVRQGATVTLYPRRNQSKTTNTVHFLQRISCHSEFLKLLEY